MTNTKIFEQLRKHLGDKEFESRLAKFEQDANQLGLEGQERERRIKQLFVISISSPVKKLSSAEVDKMYLENTGQQSIEPVKPKQVLKSVYSEQELLDMNIPKKEWIVHNILPKQGITLLTGETSVMKSFLALDMVMSIIEGEKWLLRFDTKPCNVLYIDEENRKEGLSDKIRKLRKVRGMPESKYKIMFADDLGLKLDYDKEDASQKAKWEFNKNKLKQLIVEYEIGVVVIDSLISFIQGDENNSKNMRALFHFIKPFLTYGETCWLVLHHWNKSSDNTSSRKRVRGSSDLVNSPDVVLSVKKKKTVLIMIQDKNRYNPEINDLVIQPMDTEDGGLFFQITNEHAHREDAKTKKEVGVEYLVKWITKNNLKSFKRIEAVKILVDNHGFGKSSAYGSIDILEDMEFIYKKGGLYMVRGKTTLKDYVDD